MSNVQVYKARLPQYAVEQTAIHAQRIRPLVRVESTALTTACRQAGLPIDLAELCGGLLASVADDLQSAGTLPRTSLERSKRLARVLMAAEEPAASALRCAMAASRINGEACVRHWDVVCEPREVGRLAWLLGMDTDAAHRYARKLEKRS